MSRQEPGTVAVEHAVCIYKKATEAEAPGTTQNADFLAARTVCGKTMVFWALLTCSSLSLVLGLSSGSLLARLYFVHGGSRRWLYTWIQSAGWPLILLPLLFCYKCVRATPLTANLALSYALIGCLTALDNLLYSWGISYLPISTNAIVSASQLAFNALFSHLLVGQRITPFVTNAIVIITTGTVLLGISASSDKPMGTSDKQYVVGIVVTIAASALYALILPLMELVYRRMGDTKASFVVVMEVQVGVSLVASVFSLVGMWANGDFLAMKDESIEFELGPSGYTMTLVWSTIGWQLYLLGCSGIIYLASSLMSCVFMTAMIPFLPVLAVIFFHDRFGAVKGISMFLSIWGFISYVYGGYLGGNKLASPRTQN